MKVFRNAEGRLVLDGLGCIILNRQRDAPGLSVAESAGKVHLQDMMVLGMGTAWRSRWGVTKVLLTHLFRVWLVRS